MTGSVPIIEQQKVFVGKKEFDAVEELFGNHRYIVKGDHAKNIAESIASSQQEVHVRFFTKLFSLTIKYLESINKESVKNTMSELLTNIFEKEKFHTNDGVDFWIITSQNDTPIISE